MKKAAPQKGFGALAGLRGKVPDATRPVADHGELERALEDDPDDVMTYMVYADALQHAGDPRGTLIGLQAAPQDAEVEAEIARYLVEHELYLLGGLAADLRSKTLTVEWRLGFIRRITIQPRRDERATEIILTLLDAITGLPSCRLLRELVIAPSYWIDPAVIADYLAALGRPRTLAIADIAGTPPTRALLAAFPAIAVEQATFLTRLAQARAVRIVDDMDWTRCLRLDAGQANARLAPVEKQLTTPDPFLGLEVDTLALIERGASLCGGGHARELTVPDLGGALFVDGDLVVEGVLAHLAPCSPVVVFGGLTCRALVTDMYLVVLGDLVVEDILRGTSSQHATVVFGEARVGTVAVDDEHPLVAHRGREGLRDVDDDIDWYLTSRGLPTDVAELVARLRRSA